MTTSSRITVVLEILFFIVFALTSKYLVSLWTWKYAGPMTLVSTLVLLTLYMNKRGISWREYGLKPLGGVKAKLLVLPQALFGFLAFAVAVGSVTLVAEWFQITALLDVSNGVEARFGEVRANLPKLLMWLLIVWTSAAFGEEMFFRGYLITRCQQALPNSLLSTMLAIFIPAVIFGYGHYGYQGIRGFVMTGLIGVAFGITFLLFKRSLWPVILMHGLIDTAGFVSRYLGVD